MATRETLSEIRKTIEGCIGEKVVLRTNKGRKKVKVREGVLEEAYPNVFVVRIDDGMMSQRKVSFSYSDVLTETVEVTLCTSETTVTAAVN
ncbi:MULTISPECIES: Veg family protein [unclassified Fusibacter]|uniref:Veg family protein n=1 Tax=unclassified Fusibacter TaxID=2624464 RepID=UPI0010101398|nr:MULTISPECIES: Veg family protein [unclassified Fusibacter]MCK8059294.1 Veg family protein [Fusibacter sp. A2]NPE21242.1 Veg protein [Fusibacter sp. A1]RXV62507.1 Veg protein [Fusibacter sp. A1]